eukprot:Hpha_TRINITY_DN9631_c0_g1::TRINITY_DN9631_c0_g1_i1::g.184315::m.184315
MPPRPQPSSHPPGSRGKSPAASVGSPRPQSSSHSRGKSPGGGAVPSGGSPRSQPSHASRGRGSEQPDERSGDRKPSSAPSTHTTPSRLRTDTSKGSKGEDKGWALQPVVLGEGVGVAGLLLTGAGFLAGGVCSLIGAVSTNYYTELDWGTPPPYGGLSMDLDRNSAGMFTSALLALAGGMSLIMSPVFKTPWALHVGVTLILLQVVILTGTTVAGLSSEEDCPVLLRCNWGCGSRGVTAGGWLSLQWLAALGLVRACFDRGAGRGRRRGMGLVGMGVWILGLFMLVVSLTDIDILERSGCMKGVNVDRQDGAGVNEERCNYNTCNPTGDHPAAMLWPQWYEDAKTALRVRASGCSFLILGGLPLSWVMSTRRDLCRRGWRQTVKHVSTSHNCAAFMLFVGVILFCSAQGRLLALRDPEPGERAGGAGEIVRVALITLGVMWSGCGCSKEEEEEEKGREMSKYLTLPERVERVAPGIRLEDIADKGVVWLNLPPLLHADAAKSLAPDLKEIIVKAGEDTE